MTPMSTTQRPPQRIERFLETEEVVWLSTVSPEGMPSVVPIWFSWDGEAVLILTKPGQRKVDNMRVNNRVMLALGNEEDDFDVGLIEARAELLDVDAATFMPESHWIKYARDLASIGLGRAEYVATYSQAIRLVPTRYLGWHGRSEPEQPQVPVREPLVGLGLVAVGAG
jgi:PPOX class probable F420-dependent enzyme